MEQHRSSAGWAVNQREALVYYYFDSTIEVVFNSNDLP